MVLEKTVLSGPLGELAAEGSFHFGGPLEFPLSASTGSRWPSWWESNARSLSASRACSRWQESWRATAPPGVIERPILPHGSHLRGQGPCGRTRADPGKRHAQVWGRPFGDARVLLNTKLDEAFLRTYATLTLSLPEIRPLLPEGAISQGLFGLALGDGERLPAASASEVALSANASSICCASPG